MKLSKCLVALILTLQPIDLEAAVAVQSAKTIDFTQYRTFAWRQGTPAPDPATEAMIRQSIEKQLLAKGLTRVDQGADLLVATHARLESETREEVDILNQPLRQDEGAEPTGNSGEILRELEIGTLVVDMLDGRNGLNVWRAIATRVLSNNSKGAQKRLDKAAIRMFESFPPEPD
jgi:hypothetical protein